LPTQHNKIWKQIIELIIPLLLVINIFWIYFLFSSPFGPTGLGLFYLHVHVIYFVLWCIAIRILLFMNWKIPFAIVDYLSIHIMRWISNDFESYNIWMSQCNFVSWIDLHYPSILFTFLSWNWKVIIKPKFSFFYNRSLTNSDITQLCYMRLMVKLFYLMLVYNYYLERCVPFIWYAWSYFSLSLSLTIWYNLWSVVQKLTWLWLFESRVGNTIASSKLEKWYHILYYISEGAGLFWCYIIF